MSKTMIPRAHLFYAVALLVTYAATFGVIGLICGAVVLCLWALVFFSANRPKVFVPMLAIVILGFCYWVVLLPGVVYPLEAAHRSQCKNNLKHIGLALHNYHEVHGSFPPAYIADEKGKPMHSWRVLLLPYLDEQKLYDQYDFSKPWDSPENLKLTKQMPAVFACPSHSSKTEKPETTGYMAVVGPATAWPGATARSFSQLKDGASNIILVTENHSPQVPWTEPRDLSLDQAAGALATNDTEDYGGHHHETFFYEYYSGRYMLMGDGRALFAPFGMDRTLATQLMAIDDQMPGSEWDENMTGERLDVLRWDNAIRFWACVIITLLPLPWVWLNPKSITGHRMSEDGVTNPSIDSREPT